MSGPSDLLRLGTRGSPLALAQANEVKNRLLATHGLAADRIEIVPMKTTGDAIQDRALSEAGGKGLFTKELDRALLDGAIDIAVHSAKDLPTEIPRGLAIGGYLEREDARDVFLSPRAAELTDLPQGAVVGSASLRRQALVKRLRPDLEVKLLRGNVQTRLAKLDSGEFDATILALAGLKRLGLADRATAILDKAQFPPAVGQGAIAVMLRSDDNAVATLLASVCHADTTLALTCERAFLGVLDGSCRTPIAGYAERHDDSLVFRGLLLSPDGAIAVETLAQGPLDDAARLGLDAGHDLLGRVPPALLTALGRAR